MSTDTRRKLRVLLAEKALGIPWWKRRCQTCQAVLPDSNKSGRCKPCANKAKPKTAPCREKAVRLRQAGIPTADIANSCRLSRERILQFLRPHGLSDTRNPAAARAARRARQFFQRAAYRRRQIMKRYIVCSLYKAGYGLWRINRWFSHSQHIIKREGLPRRSLGYRMRSKSQWGKDLVVGKNS